MARKPITQEELEKRITAKAFTDPELRDIAGRLADIEQRDGVWLEEVNTVGIVKPDLIDVTVDVQPGQLPDVVRDLSGLGRPNIGIFPIGIVAPDRFRVQARIRQR